MGFGNLYWTRLRLVQYKFPHPIKLYIGLLTIHYCFNILHSVALSQSDRSNSVHYQVIMDSGGYIGLSQTAAAGAKKHFLSLAPIQKLISQDRLNIEESFWCQKLRLLLEILKMSILPSCDNMQLNYVPLKIVFHLFLPFSGRLCCV